MSVDRIYKHFVGLILLVFVSCSESVTNKNLIELNRIESRLLKEPEIVISGLISPSDIISVDSLIVFCDRSCSDMIQVYSENGNYITGFLKQGRGPGESSNILKIAYNSNNKIYANVANETVFVYDISKILEGQSIPENIISLPGGMYAFSSIAVLDSSVFYVGKDIGKTDSNRTLFCLLELDNNEISHFGSLPAEDENIETYPVNDNTIQTIYQGEPLCRPDNGKIIIPYYYSVGFEIVDVDKKAVEYSMFYTLPEVDIITLPEFGINAVRKKESSKVGFLDVKCTQDYFYLLYSDKQFGNPSYKQCRYILKYDWSGSLKVKYELDQNVSSFCLNSANDTFICVSENEYGSNIIRYQL